jgi:hypothetical protein
MIFLAEQQGKTERYPNPTCGKEVPDRLVEPSRKSHRATPENPAPPRFQLLF